MNKRVKYIMRTFIVLIVLAGLVYGALFVKKYYLTKENNITYGFNVITPRENCYFAIGSADNYPVLATSKDNKEWTELYPKGRAEAVLPVNSYYTHFKICDNSDTIWLTEQEKKTNGQKEILGIYYSHNMGKTWHTVPNQYLKPQTALQFYSRQEGELTITTEPSKEEYYHTTNGGRDWNKGRLVSYIIK